MSADSLATVAEYYRLGLHVGLLRPDQASAWADSVIAAMASPPVEIIEVSWSKGLHATIDALSAVGGERNRYLAGCWLLGLLRESLSDSETDLQVALQRAMQIIRQAGLEEAIYSRFDVLEDALSGANRRIRDRGAVPR